MHGKWDERGRRRNLVWEALVLPKDDLQNFLQAIDRNGGLIILQEEKNRELGMPTGQLLKRKMHLKITGCMLRCSVCVQWHQPCQGCCTDVVKGLGACRAVARRVHPRFHAAPGGVATQKTGKFSRVICNH